MATLEIRRHTDNDEDVLSDEGMAAAVRIGERLDGDYDLVVSSGAQRATQTAACLLAGLGEIVAGGVAVDEGFRSDREHEWREAYQEAGGGHLDDFRRVAADLVEEDSAVLAEALERTLDRLEDDGRALLVGHSPTSEAAILGLTGVTVDALDKGAGVVVEEDGDGWIVEAVR